MFLSKAMHIWEPIQHKQGFNQASLDVSIIKLPFRRIIKIKKNIKWEDVSKGGDRVWFKAILNDTSSLIVSVHRFCMAYKLWPKISELSTMYSLVTDPVAHMAVQLFGLRCFVEAFLKHDDKAGGLVDLVPHLFSNEQRQTKFGNVCRLVASTGEGGCDFRVGKHYF